ncbi:MAG: precorrin-6y C5,15-methyltransferase (decarboxylating) subunit CbiE [Desulfobacterales bacterium]
MKNLIHVVGMGMCRADLSEKHLEVIRDAYALIGSERHLGWFSDHPAHRRKIDSPLSSVIKDIEAFSRSGKVVVLASGDPLFYGIGTTLIRHFGGENVAVYPNISSMAAAFSRIGLSWQNACAVSMHARNPGSALAEALFSGRTVFVLTDPENNPGRVAQMTMHCFSGRVDLHVAERLGMQDERIRKFTLEEALGETWLEPNSVILEPEKAGGRNAEDGRLKTDDGIQTPVLGGPEENYAHTKGMITKSEVRAVVLSKLRLQPGHVFWDLGAASGSVAIEASMFVTRGRILAVEKNPRRAADIAENMAKYAPGKVEVLEKTLPSAIDQLPDPDRVFIGGGGKDLAEIARRAGTRLSPGGRMVVNVVVLENLAGCLSVFEELGFETEVTQVQVSRSLPMDAGVRLAAQNPVFVVTGEKGWSVVG